MATYRKYYLETDHHTHVTEDRLAVQEYHIYVSNRIGVFNTDQILSYRIGVWSAGAFVPGMPGDFTVNSYSSVFPDVYGWDVGNKNYELSNHLGNVLVTITDRKVPTISAVTGNFTYFSAQATTVSDYYPFGMQMEERTWQASGKYRYGFNGQEKESEMGNDGDYVSFKFRMHDARLGRFFSMDPLTKSFPWNSPYAFAENKVIENKELEGAETINATSYFVKGVPGYVVVLQVQNSNGPLIINQQTATNNGTPAPVPQNPGATSSVTEAQGYDLIAGPNGAKKWRTDQNMFYNDITAKPIVWDHKVENPTVQQAENKVTDRFGYVLTRLNVDAENIDHIKGRLMRGMILYDRARRMVGVPVPTGPQPPQNFLIATMNSPAGVITINSQVQITNQVTVANGVDNLTVNVRANPADQVQVQNLMNAAVNNPDFRADPRYRNITVNYNWDATIPRGTGVVESVTWDTKSTVTTNYNVNTTATDSSGNDIPEEKR